MQLLIATFLYLILPSSFAGAYPTFQVRLSSAPNTLDWNIATSGSENAIIHNIMEGLFAQDATGFPEKCLAKSFAWSSDLKRLTIELRVDVKWTDGKPLESADFLYSFERLLNPKRNSENASLLFDVIGARDYFLGKTKDFKTVGIKAISKNTLEFTLSEPRANFLAILTHGSTYPMRKDTHLTLGPYRIQSKTDSAIKLVSTRANAEIKTALFEIIPSGMEALKLFRKKKLDYLLHLEDSLMTSTQLSGLPEPGLVDQVRVVALLHFNPSRLSTNSAEKRRRLMTEISAASLLAHHPKTRVPAPSIIPAGTLGGPSLDALHSFISVGATADPGSESLTLAYPDDALSQSIAESIQKNSGSLKIKIEALPKGDMASASNRYDLVLTIFGLDYSDPDQLLSSFLSQGTHDLFNASSGELLKIMQKSRATNDLNERAKLYRDAADLLENKMAIVMPLFYRRRAYLIRPKFIFDEKRQGTANLSQIHLAHPSK